MPARKLINSFLVTSILVQVSAGLAAGAADNPESDKPAEERIEKKSSPTAQQKAQTSAKPEQNSATSEKKSPTKTLTGSASMGKKLNVPTKAPIDAPSVSWLPPADVKPKLAMLCIHGFTLHKGTFAPFGKEMAKNGIATYAMDMRGFGELMDKKGKKTALDFDGILVDIKAMLEKIHKNHPGVPVVLLGESMGGAVALRATALYPDLVSGLISCVPARDRTGMSGSELKTGVVAGLRTIFGGFSKPMDNVALSAVEKISAKEEVRKEWKKDPLMRTSFSPKEFLQFDEFMAENFAAAAHVKDTPVLFIQGTNDKLIRPAGTWKLYECLGTANRQLVLSKNSEHLIFEEAQFRPDDLKFVSTWIARNITPLDPGVVSTKDKLPTVASVEDYSNGASGATPADGKSSSTTASAATTGESNTEIATLPPPPPVSEFKHRIETNGPPQINYWIELNRGGKTYRCNNKMEFKTGDSIRFHLIPESDGYAYLVMKAGTTGKSDVLFPNKTYGTNNYLRRGQDYPIPAEGWMQFDNHPGTEQLGLMFAHNQVDINPIMFKNRTMTAFVSPHMDGAKDLCPTRMKLSWDDSTPVIIPDDFEAISQVSSKDSSLVRLRSTSGGMVSASIELLHGK